MIFVVAPAIDGVGKVTSTGMVPAGDDLRDRRKVLGDIACMIPYHIAPAMDATVGIERACMITLTVDRVDVWQIIGKGKLAVIVSPPTMHLVLDIDATDVLVTRGDLNQRRKINRRDERATCGFKKFTPTLYGAILMEGTSEVGARANGEERTFFGGRCAKPVVIALAPAVNSSVIIKYASMEVSSGEVHNRCAGGRRVIVYL